MAGLLNIGEMGSLALHALVLLAQERDRDPSASLSAAAIADDLHASRHTLHKVITRMVNADLVESVRGAGGGVRLAVPAEEISLLRVVEAVDGPLPCSGCLFANKVCGEEFPCMFSDLTQDIERRLRDYFSATSVRALLKTRSRTRRHSTRRNTVIGKF